MLHLVTDRIRLCNSEDERVRSACLVDQARYAVDAAIAVIQLRERDLETGPLADLAARLISVTRGSRTRLVINDRLDVALAVGADGVHLRGDSFDADRVRGCAPRAFLVGRSIHSASELAAAGPVDYVIAGTVWPTASKPGKQVFLGAEGLAALVAASTIPVIAIGGIDRGRVFEVAKTGAAGLAAIGLFQGNGAGCRAVRLVETAEVIQKAFSAGNI